MGEAVELVKSCAWGNETRFPASIGQVGPKAVHPDLINGFSADQTTDRDRTNLDLAGYDWVPLPVRDDQHIEWIVAEDAATGADAFVPCDAVFVGLRKAGDVHAVAVSDNNGCARTMSVSAKAKKEKAL